jgi:hypothetical protein
MTTQNVLKSLNTLNGYDDDFTSLYHKDCSWDTARNTARTELRSAGSYAPSAAEQPKAYYVSSDPRLKHMGHNGETITLDALPRNGKVPIKCINPRHTPYNTPKAYPITGWTNQDGAYIPNPAPDVAQGDILYYYDEELSTPFINQLFIEPSMVIKDIYFDPMGTYKPHYYKIPLCAGNNNCLSWIKDSQFHREDLMSKQIWNRNKNNFGVEIEMV